jgi:hypothetical protein
VDISSIVIDAWINTIYQLTGTLKMDIHRTAHLAGVILESNSSDKISDIKGYGKNWFWLVYDPRDKDEKFQEDITLGDILAHVKLGSLLDIANAEHDIHKFRFLKPELYADSDKDEAVADAEARIAKLKKRHP